METMYPCKARGHPSSGIYRKPYIQQEVPHVCSPASIQHQQTDTANPIRSTTTTTHFTSRAFSMGSVAKETPLDETVWSHPQFIMQYGPLHNNTILIYFADSPWCERTSNNKTIMNQALYNPAMAHVVATREAFEARLRSMSGLEYVVSEAPAETGPGQGTGVWVIRKQTRKKRGGNLDDEVTVHASYYVIGQNIYPAPSLMDMMSSKLVRKQSESSREPRSCSVFADNYVFTRQPYQMRLETSSKQRIAYRNGRLHKATHLPTRQYPAPERSNQKTQHPCQTRREEEQDRMQWSPKPLRKRS